jgi:hypothetical protein
MMQPLDGSQPDDQQVTPGKLFLSQFIGESLDDLKKKRIPEPFQQVAAGAVPQVPTLQSNIV